jgi:hypothetical protein
MERTADPRIYQCAIQQSIEPSEYVLDASKFGFCPQIKDIMSDETDKPISSLDECYAKRLNVALPKNQDK